MQTEHRTFSDKKPQQLVYLELGSGNGGMLLSLSEDGFRFRAVTPVRANGNIPFAFALDGTHRLEGSGVIEWVEEDGKSGGLRFTEVSDEFRSALSAWLSADAAGNRTGREVTPVSAIPLDTMEKIRQELRAGYPVRPAVEPVAEPKAVGPKITEPAPKVLDRHSDPVIAQPKTNPVIAPQRKSGPPTQEQKRTAPPAEQKPKVAEPQISKRIFPQPKPASPQPDVQVTGVPSSAFLKPAVKPEPEPAMPAKENEPAAPKFTTFLRAAPSTPLPADSKVDTAVLAAGHSAPRFPASAFEAPAAPPSASASDSSRPFIPAFEESFEYAWEKAKLTAPADSPRVSRAAAASIITIALGAILGVLAFNYRQDVGSLMIQLGRTISGEDRSQVPPAASPAPPATESKSESKPADQPSASDKQPPATSSREAAESPTNDAKSLPEAKSSPTPLSPKPSVASRDSAPNGKSGASALIPAQSPNSAPATTAIPVEGGTGQEEFNVAREILRGNNRQRDFSRAVDLLWAGVRKGYVPAEVTLADLFRRGDGVEKNCDQARVLLVAASKKGSADARQMLEQIAEQGCQ